MEKEYYLYRNPNKINNDSKLLIGIGDSFCAGRGSCSLELWEKYDWDMDKMYTIGGYEVNKSNYENSFINQICKNHMTDWTPVNLGMSGKGNRFSVNELFLNPLLRLEEAKEKIVIFVVSGFERFDIAYNIITNNHFTTQWPTYTGSKIKRVGYAELTKEPDYETIYDDTFLLSEFIINMIHLTHWCKLNNAKLLLISGFTPELNLEYFQNTLNQHVSDNFTKKNLIKLLNVIPWSKLIKPMGFSCITDMLMHLEDWDEFIPNYGFRNMDIKTIGPNGYLTKCLHPSEKGNKLLAQIVYDHILKYDDSEEFKNLQDLQDLINNKKII